MTTQSGAAAEGQHAFLARWGATIRLASMVVIVVCLLAMVRLLPVSRLTVQVGGWIEQLGAWGPAIYGILYVVATVLFVPGATITIAAGALFGLLWGMITVSLASTTGAAAAFLIARYFARGAIERKLGKYPKFRAIDRAVSEGGWRIVALLRLSPVIPFNLQNYLYGLTAIRFWPCILASWAAMLPGTFLYVYLGYAGRAGLAAAAGAETGRTLGEWVMLGVGLAATAAVTVYVSRLARRAVKEQSEAAEAIEEIDEREAERPKQKPTRLAATLLYASLALAAIVSTAFAYANPSAVSNFFGPPSQSQEERR